MNRFTLTNLTTVLISVLSAGVFLLARDERGALSALVGGIMALLIVHFSIVVSRSFLLKKSVAFAGGVIVFKYAIFGVILYFAFAHLKLTLSGFMVGFLSLIPGLLFLVLAEKKLQ